ncbi:hypothetical protein GH714_016874 [Hevea brasiliensis]|uniref:Uncharacterized protein n=1 Tax=Hevea brasiliensis TaxID=3981 RepID=A0A6A6L9T2_HEVBR|nr:hypothetical protein GH714_016874 [Hevea brasiliensis]
MRNAGDGWKTCFALPFAFSGGRSTFVDGRWLYLFAGNRHDGLRNPDPWGFALNVVDSNKGEVERDLPYGSYPFLGCITLSDDGILYTYDTIHMRLDSYDVANRKELCSVDLPRSFWFGHEEDIELIVLAKDRFCVIWHDDGYDVNEICLYYTRLSVSYDLPKPTATVEDNRAFPIRGVEILNIVTLGNKQKNGIEKKNMWGKREILFKMMSRVQVDTILPDPWFAMYRGMGMVLNVSWCGYGYGISTQTKPLPNYNHVPTPANINMIQYGITDHEVMDSFKEVEEGIKEVKVENGKIGSDSESKVCKAAVDVWGDSSEDDLAMENVTQSGCLYGRIDVDKGKEIAYEDADGKKCDSKTMERDEGDNAIKQNSLVKQLKRTLVSSTIIRAYDDTKHVVEGTFNAIIKVRPIETEVEFTVSDIPETFALLLGRPWYHPLGGVPSTLH